MKSAALPLLLLAAFFFSAGCGSTPKVGRVVPNAPASAASSEPAPAPVFAASPNRILGYVLAIDEARDLAIIDITAEPIPADLHEGAELGVRTSDLRKTARLSASRFLRGHTLGAKIVSGLPAVGEEVFLFAP